MTIARRLLLLPFLALALLMAGPGTATAHVYASSPAAVGVFLQGDVSESNMLVSLRAPSNGSVIQDYLPENGHWGETGFSYTAWEPLHAWVNPGWCAQWRVNRDGSLTTWSSTYAGGSSGYSMHIHPGQAAYNSTAWIIYLKFWNC